MVSVRGAKKYKITLNKVTVVEDPDPAGDLIIPDGDSVVVIKVDELIDAGPATVTIDEPFKRDITISGKPSTTKVHLFSGVPVPSSTLTSNTLEVTIEGSTKHTFWINDDLFFNSPQNSGTKTLGPGPVRLNYRVTKPKRGRYKIKINQPFVRAYPGTIPNDGSILIQR
jgi:hypothetical protein